MRTLLIVDDNEEFTGVLMALIEDAFDAVFTATKLAEAEDCLRRWPVSHVISDLSLILVEASLERFTAWRREFPSVVTLAVFTGADWTDAFPPPGSDCLYSKPGDLQKLLDDFGGGMFGA